MAKGVQAIRGMHDILPAESRQWQRLERAVRELMEAYGYREIRMPLLELTELFKRSIGEVTDIVEKEMYSFTDRNGDSLSLRPEGTAGCVRACLEHGLLHNQTQRLWYQGPMFRHERPQKGRYRQFHQIGVEAFGLSGPDIDAEIILMTARLWRNLGLTDLRLELNSLGTVEERAAYRAVLVDYLRANRDRLDEDGLRRMETNPLRVLDSKNTEMADVVAAAPSLADHLGEESRSHFDILCATLDAAGVAYVVNPRLVRGLDYYSRTVFEWITTDLGAQGTVCAGGRYDGLVEQLGGSPTSAVGFAMGLERLIALLEERSPLAPDESDLYIVAPAELAGAGLLLAEELRDSHPGLRVLSNCAGGGFKAQFKRADRSGAQLALVLGESELTEGVVGVKWLRQEREQARIARSELSQFLRAELGLGAPDQTEERWL